MVQSYRLICKNGGIAGIYAGFVPPLIGSMFFRSIQFTAFAMTVTALKDWDFPIGCGVQARVILGGMASGLARAVIEAPLDAIKTRRQMGQSGRLTLNTLLRGYPVTIARNCLLMTSFFVIFETMLSVPTSVRAGLASSMAWGVIWPLDVTKTRIQSDNSLKFLKVFRGAALDGTL